jgi:ketosteroid isomerase-like protein
MKLLLLLLVGGIMTNSCTTKPSSGENVNIIQNYIQAVEDNDVEAMARFLSDDYIGIGPSVSDTTTKEMALLSWQTNSEELYEKIKYSKSRVFPITVREGDYPGNWVSNFALLDIEYKNGDKVQLLTNTSYMIEQGKIIRSFTFYNEADALRQLNYVFIDLDNLGQ